jgi:DNA-binding NarL/FixJ family response regulator
MSEWEICGEAINGRDGIEKAQLLNPDLVVLDLSMPEMDGIRTAKVLNSLFPTLPIIMFTNFAEDQFLERDVMSAGIRQVVSKSDSAGLVRAMQSAFEARAGGLVA